MPLFSPFCRFNTGIEITRRRKADLKKAPAGARTFSSDSLQNAQQKCHVCSKTVYSVEFVGASDKVGQQWWCVL